MNDGLATVVFRCDTCGYRRTRELLLAGRFAGSQVATSCRPGCAGEMVSVGRYGSEIRDGRLVATLTSATQEELMEIADTLRGLQGAGAVTGADLEAAVAPLGDVGRTIVAWARENAGLIAVELIVGFILILVNQAMAPKDEQAPTQINIDQVIIGESDDEGAVPSRGTEGSPGPSGPQPPPGSRR